jgi:hypothetical protein
MTQNSLKFENDKYITESIASITGAKTTVEEEISKILEMFNEDFKDIDSTNLVNEANKNIRLYNKFSMLFFEKKNVYAGFEKKRDKLEVDLLSYYKFDYDKSTKMTDGLADKFVKAHPLYAVLFEFIKTYKNYLDLIERAIDICKDRGYAVKNIIEWKKIEFGMN